MRIDLKPCPFCGGTAEFDHDDDGYRWIACQSCGVSTDTGMDHNDDARVRLAKEWNKRTPGPVRLKDHLFRELVNDLRDIATEWHGSQQLRERISGRLRKSIEPSATPCQGHARQQEAEEIHEDAKRLEWVMNKATLQDLSMYPRHVLSRGGDGDMSDIRTFIDAAMAQEAKSGG